LDIVERKYNDGTNQANKVVSWSDVVSGKVREKTTNNDEKGKESLF